MSDFFFYEYLTWPEVSALPRDLPLVLPLGENYPMEQLASALGNPARIGLLPPIPYGWQGSGLWVPESLLGTFVSNLLDSLRDDGFSRVLALTPAGIEFGLGKDRIALHPIPDPTLQNTLLPPITQKDKVILIPVGHTEQHAYHLPLSTDTIIIEAVAQGSATRIPEQAYALPVMPYGVSMHRSAFAATLTAGGRAFEDFFVGVIDQLTSRGFNRFYLLSGHGGNSSFLVNVVKYAGDRHKRIFCATAYLYLSGASGADALEKYRLSNIGGMGHAGELETSLILHLQPELVHMERVVDETDFISTPSYYMDWIEGGSLTANPPWEDDTRTGAYGAGSLATAENGQRWLEAAIEEKIGHVSEIHEQHNKREVKRSQR
jgi:creatinine amidohydrolase